MAPFCLSNQSRPSLRRSRRRCRWRIQGIGVNDYARKGGAGEDTTHYTLHTTHYTLYTTHYTLHTTHYTRKHGASQSRPSLRRGRRRCRWRIEWVGLGTRVKACKNVGGGG